MEENHAVSVNSETNDTKVDTKHENGEVKSEVKVPASFHLDKELDRINIKVLKQALLAYIKDEPSHEQKLKEFIYKEVNKGKAP